MRKILLIGAGVLALGFAGQAIAAGKSAEPAKQKWSFSGIFGTYDRAQLRRGYQVYANVCAACHSLSLVAYRNLMEIGFTEKEVEAIAAEKELPGEPDEDGEPTTRQALPSDKFVPPFANENAAKAANNGAYPPDLSLVAKSRIGGPNYLYSLLTGYSDPPKNWKDADGKPKKLGDGQYFNKYMPGQIIAMAPPLSDDGIEYFDKTKATVSQQAKDVSAFMKWAADPKLEERKRMGIKVILFLLLLTGLLFAWKRKVWKDVH